MRVRIASLLPLSLLALVLALSACGSSSVKSTIDPVAAAAEKTSTQKTLSMSMTMTMKMSPLPTPITVTAEGVENLSEQKASMSVDMSEMASLAGGKLGSSSDWKMDEVLDGLVLYMRAPFLQESLGTDKQWFKMDMADVGKQMGLDLSAFMSYSPDQTTQYLDFLRGGKGAEKLGQDLVRGVETTHYRATIDFDQYIDNLPADKRAAAKKSMDNLEKLAKPEYGPFDVWVDAQGRVRREEFSFSETISNGGDISMTMDIEFFDFNKPVSITVPPADQTVDLMDLVGSLDSN